LNPSRRPGLADSAGPAFGFEWSRAPWHALEHRLGAQVELLPFQAPARASSADPPRRIGRADAPRHFRQAAIVLHPRSEFSHPRHQFMLRNDGRSHYIDCRADTSNVALQALRGGYLDDQLVRHA